MAGRAPEILPGVEFSRIRAAGHPVQTRRERRMAMTKRILAPIDARERSEAIVPVVAALARDSGATVRLLRVYPVPEREVRDTGQTIAYADQVMAGLTAAGEDALQHVEAQLNGVPVERVVRFGDTVEE